VARPIRAQDQVAAAAAFLAHANPRRGRSVHDQHASALMIAPHSGQ